MAALAGLLLRRGREKQTHLAQDRQNELLGQQRDLALTTALPNFYKQAQTMPEDGQTQFLSAIRNLMSKGAQSGVYVPGETGESGPSERVNFNTQFPVAQAEDSNSPFNVGADGLATRSAPIFRPPNTVPQSVQLGAHGARNPFLKPPIESYDPKDRMSLLNEIRAAKGDSQKALVALFRQNFPGLNLDVDSNVLNNLDESPEDKVRLANVDQSKAGTLKTQAETNKLTQFLPLELEQLLKENKGLNEKTYGQIIENKLAPKRFGETVRSHKANEALNGRAIDAGMFNQSANRGVQMFNIKTDAATAASNLEFDREKLEFEKSKPRDNASAAEKQEYERRKNAYNGIDSLAKERDSEKGPIQYIQKIDLVLESGKDADGEPLTPEKKTMLQKTRQMKVDQLKRINEDIKSRKRDLAPKKVSFLTQPRDGVGRFTLPAPQSQRVIFTQSNNNA